MEFAAGIQILSFGILGAAGIALFLDFLKAKRQLARAMVAWQVDRKEVLR
jgi:hypothetical protein